MILKRLQRVVILMRLQMLMKVKMVKIVDFRNESNEEENVLVVEMIDD